MRRRLTPERAAELRQWTAERAARFGYLAGCGCSAEAILADDNVGAKSLQAVRSVATHWGLPLGSGGLRTVIPMSFRDHDLLECAAAGRGVSVASLAATLIHIVVAERLVDAVLDDGKIPSRSVRDYLAQFGVAAIWVTSSCRIGTGRDLARVGPLAVWWARDQHTADQIIMAIGEQHPATVEQAAAEILAAAADRLGAVLSDHTVVLQRAGAAVRELDLRLEAAQSSGTMAFFNSEFRKRRLAAAKSGVKFIPYWEARRRLRQVLASAAAGRSVSELMQAVFDAPAKL